MENINLVIENIIKKSNLFEKYEKLTEQMLDEDFSKYDKLLKNREKIKNEISEIDKTISGIIENIDNKENIINAIKNSCNRSDVQEHLLEIFDMSQNTFSIISRIVEMENQLFDVMEKEKNKIENDLKNLNKENKANPYINASISPSDNNGILSFKYNKI